MRKTSKKDYFTLFTRQSAYCVQAAELLRDFLRQFDPFSVPQTVERMHRLEHEADFVRGTLTETLSGDFLPPIEREDILALSNALDTVTDTAEDTLRHVYMFNIEASNPDAAELSDVTLDACRALHNAVCAFRDFKKMDRMRPLLRQVKQIEERSDALYTDHVRRLYCGTNDPRQLLRWTQIYGGLEGCCDACAHASEVMQTVMFKNA